MKIRGRLHRSHSAEEATLEELIEMFGDPRKAQRAERRWARHTKRHRAHA